MKFRFRSTPRILLFKENNLEFGLRGLERLDLDFFGEFLGGFGIPATVDGVPIDEGR